MLFKLLAKYAHVVICGADAMGKSSVASLHANVETGDAETGEGVTGAAVFTGDGVGTGAGVVGGSVVGTGAGVVGASVVGAGVGNGVGETVGDAVGVRVGEAVGLAVGFCVGEAVGDAVGLGDEYPPVLRLPHTPSVSPLAQTSLLIQSYAQLILA